MTVIRHDSPRAFLDRAGPLLYQAEAENNLLLGLAETASRETVTPPRQRWFLTIEEGDQVVGATLLAEPFWNAIITRLPTAGLTKLADYFSRESVPVQGVIGPDSYPREFAALWSRSQQVPATLKFNQRIYHCTAVNSLPNVPGSCREASSEELDFLIEWGRGFDLEINSGSPSGHSDEFIRRAIDRRALFLWDHAGPVACAATGRETDNGIAVMQVYTPPPHRGRGYATALVAAVTQLQLDRGKRFCALYTDLANPTSNAIYQRIGYVPVCDSQLWKFNSQ